MAPSWKHRMGVVVSAIAPRPGPDVAPAPVMGAATCSQVAARPSAAGLTPEQLHSYQTDGFLFLRGFFSPTELQAVMDGIDVKVKTSDEL